ncbi:MAG: XRE family transcriptional regulator [Defluviitaleaceae bacterium]|nr:XRE family transcriptional regulator [Defluviitaleaceae bacterium]
MKPRSKAPGDKNIVGTKVLALRLERKIKQKDFLAQLQSLGMDISATSLSRLEGQYRLVQDMEVVILAKALGVKSEALLSEHLPWQHM